MPVEHVDPADVPGLRVDDVLAAVICREDGIADPAGVTAELVRRAAGVGVDVREHTDALSLDAESSSSPAAPARPRSAARAVELPVRPLVRQLVDVGPVAGVPHDLPMTIEASRASTSAASARRCCGSRCPSRRRAGTGRRS